MCNSTKKKLCDCMYVFYGAADFQRGNEGIGLLPYVLTEQTNTGCVNNGDRA